MRTRGRGLREGLFGAAAGESEEEQAYLKGGPVPGAAGGCAAGTPNPTLGRGPARTRTRRRDSSHVGSSILMCMSAWACGG